MTAQPQPNPQILNRLIDLEKKVEHFVTREEFDDLQTKFREQTLLLDLITSKDNTAYKAKANNSGLDEKRKEPSTSQNGQESSISELEVKVNCIEAVLMKLIMKVNDAEQMRTIMATRVPTDANQQDTSGSDSSLCRQKVGTAQSQKDVPTKDEQLLICSRNGSVEEVTSLIASGTNVNVVDGTGKTPLHHAAEEGHDIVCRLLINKGADVNVGTDTVTPLHLASSAGRFFVVELLTGSGASVNATNADNNTPLYCAAKEGDVAICEHLISSGALLDKGSTTPLHVACMKGHPPIVELLISCGASLDLPSYDEKYTALHYAAFYGHAAVCEILLTAGANINATNYCGQTALLLACLQNDFYIVKLLVFRGAAVSSVDAFFRSPLYCEEDYGLIYNFLKQERGRLAEK